jgi:signal peptidase
MFMQSTPGLVVCVAVPLVLFIGYDMLRRRKYDKSKAQDMDALMAELEALRAKQNTTDTDSTPKE